MTRSVSSGAILEGPGAIERYAAAILENAKSLSMEASVVEESQHRIVLTIRQINGWHQILLHALPQQITFSLEQRGPNCTIEYGATLFSWYFVFVVLTSLMWPICLALAFGCYPVSPSVWIPWFSPLWISSVLLIFVPLYLLEALSGTRIECFIEKLRQIADSRLGLLQEKTSLLCNPGTRHKLIYLAYSMLVSIILLVFSPKITLMGMLSPLPGGLILPAVVVAALFLCCAGGIMLWDRGFGLRATLLAPGFLSLAAALFFVAPPMLCLWGTQAIRINPLPSIERKLALAVSRQSSANSNLDFGPEMRSDDPRKGRGLLAGLFLVLLLMPAAAMGFLYNAVRISPLVAEAATRMRMHDRDPLTRSGTSGAAFLTRFRMIFGGVLILIGAVVLLGTAVACAFAFHALFCPRTQENSHGMNLAVHIVASLFSLLFSDSTANPLATAIIRMGWVIHGTICLALLMLSSGELACQRRRCRRKLSKANGSLYPDLVQALDEICRAARMPPPVLIVTEKEGINAWSSECGWFRRRRLIEVTEGAVKRFKQEGPLMKALLAHELAHFKNNDVAKLNVVRWIGRITFVGDSFVFALADSFGYERRADYIATTDLGIPKADMKLLLGEIERMANGDGHAADTGMRHCEPGISAEHPGAGPTEYGISKQEEMQWASAWREFVFQYSRPFEMAYWHPSIRERIDSLS